MKVPFPAFIRRFIETSIAENDQSVFDIRNTKNSKNVASPVRQSVKSSSMEIKLSISSLEPSANGGKHLSTPIPQTPAFLRNKSKYVSFSKDPTAVALNQEMRGCYATALTTPLIMSSLNRLESVSTPADAFPDILEIVDQTWPASSYETSPLLNTSFQVSSVTDSVLSFETPKNELDLTEILVTYAKQTEHEKNVSSRSYAYIRPEDELLSRKSGQRKCQHAKRMTEDEKKYYKNIRTKERNKHTCYPAQGVRRSTRITRYVRYF